MMRGNMVGLTLGAWYVFGWVIGAPSMLRWAATILVVVAATALVAIGYDSDVAGPANRQRRLAERRHASVVLWLLYFIALLVGAVLSAARATPSSDRLLLLGAFIALVAISLQSSRSYNVYSDEFVKAVYRGFIQFSKHSHGRDPFD